MARYIGTGIDPRYPKDVVVDIGDYNASEQTIVDAGFVKPIGLDQDPARDVTQLAASAVRGELGPGNLNDPVEIQLAHKAGLIDDNGVATELAYSVVHEGVQPSPEETTKIAAALKAVDDDSLVPRSPVGQEQDQEGELSASEADTSALQAADVGETATAQAADTPDPSGDDDGEKTVAQLREEAKAKGVEGYSSMNKADLEKALAKA